jgi:putative flippase GtrA
MRAMLRLTAPSPQFLLFVAGGALSALVDIGLLQLLVMNKVEPFSATTYGFLAGLIVNYAFHAKVTFKNVTTLATFTRFLCVVGINYLITLACVASAVALFQWPLLGKLVSLPLVALNGFFLSKYWIFK